MIYKLMNPNFNQSYKDEINRKKDPRLQLIDSIHGPRPIFKSINDTLDLIDSDISSVQSFYDSYLPEKQKVLSETSLLTENSIKRITNLQQQEILNQDILKRGSCLASGQTVFHCGVNLLPRKLSEPLSTSFSPTRALVNGDSENKVFNAGVSFLYCLTTITPSIHAYVYNKPGNEDEHEALLATGPTIFHIDLYKQSRKDITINGITKNITYNILCGLIAN